MKSAKPPKVAKKKGWRDDNWTPTAWVYFIWIVAGYRVYCKIGHSTNPDSRYRQLLTGIPEQPFQYQLLPCLNLDQAWFFESLLHDQLRSYKTQNEWFSHQNAKHFYKVINSVLDEVFHIFHIFGYENRLEIRDLDGAKPVLYANGFISHVID